MKGYQCPGCGQWIGLIFGDDRPGDKPGRYRCPHTHSSMLRTGQVTHGPQLPIRRDTPPQPPQPVVATVILKRKVVPDEVDE